jgi:hypothetical protein
VDVLAAEVAVAELDPAGALVLLDDGLPDDELLDDALLPPHAATPPASATAPSATHARAIELPQCVLIMLRPFVAW